LPGRPANEIRTENGGYRRDYLRPLAQRIEVDMQELRIMGSKSELLRTLVAASSAKAAGLGVPSSVTEVARPKRFELLPPRFVVKNKLRFSLLHKSAAPALWLKERASSFSG
jgi:hypothetical protein